MTPARHSVFKRVLLAMLVTSLPMSSCYPNPDLQDLWSSLLDIGPIEVGNADEVEAIDSAAVVEREAGKMLPNSSATMMKSKEVSSDASEESEVKNNATDFFNLYQNPKNLAHLSSFGEHEVSKAAFRAIAAGKKAVKSVSHSLFSLSKSVDKLLKLTNSTPTLVLDNNLNAKVNLHLADTLRTTPKMLDSGSSMALEHDLDAKVQASTRQGDTPPTPPAITVPVAKKQPGKSTCPDPATVQLQCRSVWNQCEEDWECDRWGQKSHCCLVNNCGFRCLSLHVTPQPAPPLLPCPLPSTPGPWGRECLGKHNHCQKDTDCRSAGTGDTCCWEHTCGTHCITLRKSISQAPAIRFCPLKMVAQKGCMWRHNSCDNNNDCWAGQTCCMVPACGKHCVEAWNPAKLPRCWGPEQPSACVMFFNECQNHHECSMRDQGGCCMGLCGTRCSGRPS